MRIPKLRHRWNVSLRRAIAIQRELALHVVPKAPAGFDPQLIAGVDAAFADSGHTCLAAAVVWDSMTGVIVEETRSARPVRFPYIPGLLTFREGPAVLAALRQLRTRPELLMFDGQGIAHQRRCGIASHLGVLAQVPAIGCAKSRLVGEFGDLEASRGCRAPLRLGEELIGCALRTQDNAKPLFVSVGHLIDLETACRIALKTSVRFRIPEPTRLADKLVAQAKAERQLGLRAQS